MVTIPIDPVALQSKFPPRPRASHKGDFGSVGIIGGAPGMVGAALLAGRAALYFGAGRVFVGTLDPRIATDAQTPELMLIPPEAVLTLALPGCRIVGPGLGQSPEALHLLKTALASAEPLLLDADSLNLLADHPVLQHRLAHRAAPTILTPHPGEAARLLNVAVADIQADRQAAVRTLAAQTQAISVLKGADSLIAAGNCVWQNTTGNPGLAAPGMGDVLSGMIAALIAQGMPALEATQWGIWLHGKAADTCVAQGVGPRGLTASEVSLCARSLLNGHQTG